MHIVNRGLLVAAILVQAGCTNMDALTKKFETNAYCKIGEAKAASVSSWWLFGISTDLANGAALCTTSSTGGSNK